MFGTTRPCPWKVGCPNSIVQRGSGYCSVWIKRCHDISCDFFVWQLCLVEELFCNIIFYLNLHNWWDILKLVLVPCATDQPDPLARGQLFYSMHINNRLYDQVKEQVDSMRCRLAGCSSKFRHGMDWQGRCKKDQSGKTIWEHGVFPSYKGYKMYQNVAYVANMFFNTIFNGLEFGWQFL